jgi:hypothetical protein
MYIRSQQSSMETFGKVNNRDIIYQKHAVDVNWTKAMPTNNWLLIVVIEEQNRRILDEISRKAIVNNACYICCIGKQAELFHDMIDEEIVFRQVYIDNLYMPPFDILTTYETKLNEGLWFAGHAANHSTVKIDTILCLDASKLQVKEAINRLINRKV